MKKNDLNIGRRNALKMSGYFGDSPASLVSYIVKEEKLNKEEIEKLKALIKKMN